MTVKELRTKYPIFEYISSDWSASGDDLHMSWEMKTGELVFHPKVTIFGAGERAKKINKDQLDNLVFHLGLADIFSYWKTTCSPTIQISACHLDDNQLGWWHDLLIKGMGQYFYENQIDFRDKDFVNFVIARSEATKSPPRRDPALAGQSHPGSPRSLTVARDDNMSVLIPVGGGKDSAVTLDLLSKNFPDNKIGAFSMNISWSDKMLPSCRRLMDEAGIKEQVFVQRSLDPQLKTLKEKGYPNGHIPFSAYMSFLSILLANLYGYSQVSFSNERSSNETNLEYLGNQINHQYSKTFEFENAFRKYNESYLSNVSYFSFLRPLYELQIMKIFSNLSKYFAKFRSCNRGYQTDSWCGKCPKCLAVYVGLYPFVDKSTLQEIFGHDLFSDAELLQLTKDVLGFGDKKPFECIGTFDETIVAFYLSIQKYQEERNSGRGQNDEGQLPVLLDFFKKEILPKYPNIQELKDKILNGWDEENNLPEDYKTILKDAYAS